MELDEFIKSSVESLVLIPSESEGIPDNMCDMPFHDNSPPLDVSKDQFEDFSDSNDDSTSNDDDSFSIDNIEYVEASPPDSELVGSEVMKIVIPKVGGIDDDILLTIKDDILQYEAFYDDHVKEISSSSTTTYSNSSLYDSFIFDLLINPFPPSNRSDFYEFVDELAHIISPPDGNTTTGSDISLPEYEAFYDDHVKEISSSSTTTYSNSSLYDSFIFDLLINPFPPSNRSDFYEFVDELAHIISPPEYDCFCFNNEPNSGGFHYGCGG
uniref:Reverse transcriptase domain-containing protein n=1 Tax=Tanacetum cinerariifolium TaxID=118510 RepID=A0A699KEH3_TANCI|nr:hypothetical protein [Tanacetum cinerariifolium]